MRFLWPLLTRRHSTDIELVFAGMAFQAFDHWRLMLPVAFGAWNLTQMRIVGIGFDGLRPFLHGWVVAMAGHAGILRDSLPGGFLFLVAVEAVNASFGMRLRQALFPTLLRPAGSGP
jgi:hypothetical protein